jgi:hypothetical protein
MSATIFVTPDLVREFTGEDVMCLHAICQPLVNEMQAVIRHQREQLNRAVAAMEYSIRRQGDNLAGTQQFTNLTKIIAEIKGMDVDAVRDHFIPGSASIHKERA